jgi:hypothetical protein
MEVRSAAACCLAGEPRINRRRAFSYPPPAEGTSVLSAPYSEGRVSVLICYFKLPGRTCYPLWSGNRPAGWQRGVPSQLPSRDADTALRPPVPTQFAWLHALQWTGMARPLEPLPWPTAPFSSAHCRTRL